MIEYILEHIHNTLNTSVRVFDEEGRLKAFYGDQVEKDALVQDKGLKEILFKEVSEEYPLLYEKMSFTYFMVIRHERTVYIIGPNNCNFIKSRLGAELDDHIYGPQDQIPTCSLKAFCDEGLLVFNVLNALHMTQKDLLVKNCKADQVVQGIREELTHLYFHNQEARRLHNSYLQEARELNYLREGNIDQMIATMDEVEVEDCAILSKNPLRAIKNLAIVALAIAARAAIDGGMYPEEAFSINDSCILQIDAANTVTKIIEITRSAKIGYVKEVNKIKSNTGHNRIVEEAKNLIFKNMHSKIVVNEIAEQLSVTPEYLSVLFKKTSGVSTSEYILRKKVELVENMLIYSSLSITDIAYYLGFCSQSHLGKCFKKINGITPQKYRDRYAAEDFNH